MPRGFLRTLHGHILCTTLASIAAVTSTAAQDSDTLDCSNAVTVDGVTYNLAPLAGEHTLRRTRETPPSTMEDELQFNLCQDIPRREDIAEADQVFKFDCTPYCLVVDACIRSVRREQGRVLSPRTRSRARIIGSSLRYLLPKPRH